MPVAVRDVLVTVLGAGGLGLGLGAAQSSGHFGHALVVAFVVVAPAIAIARLLPGVNRALALIVGAAGAAVINALVAQAMLSANAWSPRAGVVAVGLTAALLWLVPTGGRSAEIHPLPSSSDKEHPPHAAVLVTPGDRAHPLPNEERC